MSVHMILCLVIFVLTIASFLWGKISMGLTALLSMVLLVLTGCIDITTALSGFSNSNTIIMACMFIISAGFSKTQMVAKLSRGVAKAAKGSFTRCLLYTSYDLRGGKHFRVRAIAVDIIGFRTFDSLPRERQAGGLCVIACRSQNCRFGGIAAACADAVFAGDVVRDLHIGDGPVSYTHLFRKIAQISKLLCIIWLAAFFVLIEGVGVDVQCSRWLTVSEKPRDRADIRAAGDEQACRCVAQAVDV